MHADRHGEHPQKRRRPPQTAGHNGQQRDPALLTTLARHVLRLEEEIKVLKQDHALVSSSSQANTTYYIISSKQPKRSRPSNKAIPHGPRGHLPLKTVMAVALFQELGVRLERTCTEEAIATKVQERGWRDPATGWKFQRWNPTLKCLEEDTTQKPTFGPNSGGPTAETHTDSDGRHGPSLQCHQETGGLQSRRTPHFYSTSPPARHRPSKHGRPSYNDRATRCYNWGGSRTSARHSGPAQSPRRSRRHSDSPEARARQSHQLLLHELSGSGSTVDSVHGTG